MSKEDKLICEECNKIDEGDLTIDNDMIILCIKCRKEMNRLEALRRKTE